MSDKTIRKGSVVISKCGHDKGDFLIVAGFEGDRVLVVDGDKRKLESPKKKNIAHLRYRGEDIEEFPERLSNNALTDAAVRKMLKEYTL